MFILFLFLVLMIVILFITDGIPLAKNKKRPELMVFLFLITLSVVLFVCFNAGLPITLKSLNEFFSEYGKKLFGSSQ